MTKTLLENVSIRAISICVQYSDYLACVLPSWLRVFDRITIVTGPGDTATQNLCRQYGVDCLPTSVFWSGTPLDFYKGRGYREAMKTCSDLQPADWMVHIDSDMYLPPGTNDLIRKELFDDQKFHGFERLMCNSPSDWSKYLRASDTSQLSKPNERFEHLGVVGFFQLFNWGRFCQLCPKGYPANSNDAGMDDVKFSAMWGKPRVGQIWNSHHKLYHLGLPLQNWKGRRSAPFHVLSKVVYALAAMTSPDQLSRIKDRCQGADRIWLLGNSDEPWWNDAAVELDAVPLGIPGWEPSRSYKNWRRLLDAVPLVPQATYRLISTDGESGDHELCHEAICEDLRHRSPTGLR